MEKNKSKCEKCESGFMYATKKELVCRRCGHRRERK